MSGRITTHVLDTARGLPAENIPLKLYILTDPRRLRAEAVTNADGRCEAPLLCGDAVQAGVYELVLSLGAYFARHHPGLPKPLFLDEIVLRFGVADASGDYHVPLLVSPYGYSTYRGS